MSMSSSLVWCIKEPWNTCVIAHDAERMVGRRPRTFENVQLSFSNCFGSDGIFRSKRYMVYEITPLVEANQLGCNIKHVNQSWTL
jgi:hypothetical protein